jgi:hypothetical protein
MLEPSAIEAAARLRFIGRPIGELRELQQDKTIATQCRQPSSNNFDCDFWLEIGLARNSGFRVQATAGPEQSTEHKHQPL